MLKNQTELGKLYQYISMHILAAVIIKQYIMTKYAQIIIKFAPRNMCGSSISFNDRLRRRLKPFNLWTGRMSEWGFPRWGSVHTVAARARHYQAPRRSKHHWATHWAHLSQPSLWTCEARNTKINSWAVEPCSRPKLVKYICTHASVRRFSTDSCSRTLTDPTV